jgi:hypothetical protein
MVHPSGRVQPGKILAEMLLHRASFSVEHAQGDKTNFPKKQLLQANTEKEVFQQ